MTNDVKILNARDSIPALTSPTGVQYKAFRLGEPHLFEIFAVRTDEEGKEYPDRGRKQPVEGCFTSEAKALEALRKFLTLAWAESDAVAEKLTSKREKRTDQLAA